MDAKYPRTPHLPWSKGATRDDLTLMNVDHFHGTHVVVTEKIDGENTTMTSQTIHARSLSSSAHPSQSWVRRLHGQIAHEISPGWRLIGENVYAQHAIHYDRLPSYFFLFAVVDDRGYFLSWDDTCMIAELIQVPVPHVLYRGEWAEPLIRDLAHGVSAYGGEQEGYVVRRAGTFHQSEFKMKVAKYVRANHVDPTANHWSTRVVTPNGLLDDTSHTRL